MNIRTVLGTAAIALILGIGVQTGVALQKVQPKAGPYSETKVTSAMVKAAFAKANAEKKFLMIEFGANWCEDCVVLAKNLEEGETRAYFQKNFVVLKVDVGQFDRNLDIARELNVTLGKGIPTAAFFAPDGKRVGATNQGELEPSRKYGTKQIYAFLKDIAERRTIRKPGT